MKKLIKYIFIVTLSVFVIVFTFFLSRHVVNELVINNYNKGIYNRSLIKYLGFININEKYIYYYNDGNILYKDGKYKEAESKYRLALEKNVPEDRYCIVIDNLSLSIVGQINDDMECKDQQELYNKAIEELVNSGCSENDETSIKLHEQISGNLSSCDKTKEEEEDDDGDDDKDDDEDEEEKKQEQEKEDSLNKKNGAGEDARNDDNDRYDWYDSGSYSYNGKRW